MKMKFCMDSPHKVRDSALARSNGFTYEFVIVERVEWEAGVKTVNGTPTVR